MTLVDYNGETLFSQESDNKYHFYLIASLRSGPSCVFAVACIIHPCRHLLSFPATATRRV
ncbi:protein of unknown function [Candidatus Methylomirabilis oxygeniifera]|uniref:Uncharacterized protein n=1 Tax=Methylomirabilis oxygeniifera TaxID=671143 RepID=D5ML51_METO1|nr:protein of unknown function [Candidatus Methylomirabilis oxyfera]